MTMKYLDIYLTRHGQTEFNATARLQGWADSPLTEQGKQVASELGEKLQDVSFQSAFCSTLPRTLSTAQLILAGAGQADLPIQALDDLREYHFGAFEGRPAHELYECMLAEWNLPNVDAWLKFYRHADYNVMAETVSRIDPQRTAETEAHFVSRLQRGMARVIESQTQSGNVLVVSHGMAIVALLKSIDPTAILYKSPANSSVSRLRYDGETWQILSVGQTDF